MIFVIEFSRAAEKQLTDISGSDQKKIAKKIDKLASDPFPPGYKKLEGNDDLYRIRQGDYRIIYTVSKKKLIILIVKIGHCREIYR